MAEQKVDKPSFKLTYYAFDGRGAAPRLAAVAGGIAYEEEITTFEDHGKSKAAGQRRWSGPPELVIYGKDGKQIAWIGQSNAILRYIGNLSGAYPSNPLQRALCDEVLDSCEDIIGLLIPLIFAQTDDQKKAIFQGLCGADKLPYWFGKFNARLQENEKRGNKSGFFVGDKLSIADYKAFFIVGDERLAPGADVLLKPFPYVTKFIDAVKATPGYKKFRDQFTALQKENKDNKTTCFKYGGKTVPGSL